MKPGKIDIAHYNYPLPDNKIARYPLEKRDQSKLLVYESSSITDHRFYELPQLLSANSRLIVNNTRVIRARLHFRKTTGAHIEIFCLEPYQPSDYQESFAATESCTWSCAVGNLKKWKGGALVLPFTLNGENHEIRAELQERKGAEVTVKFSWTAPDKSFGEILDALGDMPIPPYLKREAEQIDQGRYQTVYSRIKGSVAAPTAGLHFTDHVFEQLQKKGISLTHVTLHVGAGTFKPVQEKNALNHDMHTETFFVTREAIEELMDTTRPKVAVGTTSVRTIESIYWLGVKMLKEKSLSLALGQWEAYDLPSGISLKKALQAVMDYMDAEGLQFLEAATQIMIVPGYEFKLTDALVTNFHLPQSTLLLLIAAFIGEDWRKLYDFALEHNYRFLSYGDSSLLKNSITK